MPFSEFQANSLPVPSRRTHILFCQMAGIEGSDELNNRQRFKGFYRTDATSEFVGAALAEMARQFKWTQMAIVTQGGSLFRLVCVCMCMCVRVCECVHVYVRACTRVCVWHVPQERSYLS